MSNVTWRELEHELNVISSIQKGDRLRVMNGVFLEPLKNRWASALVRWVASEGRDVTVRFLADLLCRIDAFRTFCMDEAKSCALGGEGLVSMRGDACPQCLRVRCACAQIGLLRALDCDMEKAIVGLNNLAKTYADDPAVQSDILKERENFSKMKKLIHDFILENEG
mmetsp:Transcript_32011/g.85457  ORF Transcript_32011/g.85457 Transcript_32011/m.85457 type:complete len:167 (-) Transcript_32011:144-644(-)